MISGVFTFWSVGFAYGFWEYSFAAVFISVAYFVLVLCLAEMISILPFSGGSYGFSRVTMGPFIGFLIGCFDSVSLIAFNAILVHSGCSFIKYAAGPAVPDNIDPLLWFIMYFVCLLILIPMSQWTFKIITVTTAICLCFFLLFIFCSIPNQDFEANVLKQETHSFYEGMGMTGFMEVLPVTTWMYIGIDLTCLVCDDTADVSASIEIVLPINVILGCIGGACGA